MTIERASSVQVAEDWSDLHANPVPNDPEILREAAEDAYDILCALHAKIALSVGESEMLPGDMVKRLLIDGDNPLIVWREHRGLTQKALAAKVKMTAAQLSEIEKGKKSGSIATLRKLSVALGVTVDDLLPAED
jgi:DNA-binding XRE family transcriptional regulator